MLKKTFFLLLFSIIHSQIVNLTVFKLKDFENITVDKPSGLICYEVHNSLKKKNNFYLYVNCNEPDKKMSKTIFYNLTDVSCNDLNNLTIDFNNLKSQFTYSIKEPKVPIEGGNGFFYEYNIKKKEVKKFMLTLFYDFTGTKFSILYAPVSINKIVKVVKVLFFLFIFIIILIIVCICICIRNRRLKSTAPQFQTSNLNMVNLPEEGVIL